jgi:hypothetical protein
MKGSRAGLIVTVDFYRATILSDDKGMRSEQIQLK